jgi:cytochrome c551/c552
VNLSLSMIIALTALGQTPAEAADAKFVQSFFQTNCVRCHNAKVQKGKFALHDLKSDVAGDRASYAAILERLRAGDMPPEKEPQPDLDTLRKVADLIQARLGGQPKGTAQPAEVAIRPGEGNRLPHSELFGSKPGPSVPPPARLWRFSPEGYAVGFSHSLGISPKSFSKRFSQPFAFQSEAGIKDYAALYWIDDGSTDILLRNAEKIVAALTNRNEKGQDYKSKHRDFLALVDPAKAPSRQEMEVAVRSVYRMALVREPSAEEIEGLVALHKKCSVPPGDLPSAGRTMLMAPLLSPEALHRFELGRGADDAHGAAAVARGAAPL